MTHNRSQQIADHVRETLARLLREQVRDPRIGFVTLTDVALSPDMKQASIYVSVLGSEPEQSLEALNRAASFLRRALAHEAGLRFTPKLRFMIDESVAGGFRMDQLLEDLPPAGPDEEEREP